MLSVVQETVGWGWAYLQHMVIMMSWAWIPGFLVAALLSARYRSVLQAITLKERHGGRAFLASVGWGMTSGAGRRSSLETAKALWSEGVPDQVVLAFLVSSHSLVLYSLVLFTVLIGLEFSLGVLLGGLVMISLLRLIAPAQGQPGFPSDPVGELVAAGPESWTSLFCSGRGWGEIVREIGRYLRNVGLSLIGGLILGSVVLAIDTRGDWFFPKWMGDETLAGALASSFLAPLLSVVLFLAPGGNLIVVSSIWKTWTLTYSGVISFVLMSLLNPLAVWGLVGHSRSPRGWAVSGGIYLSAALGGLAVARGFALLGIQVTHVPWFRELVDKIMMMLPFTMLGAPGGGMKGM